MNKLAALALVLLSTFTLAAAAPTPKKEGFPDIPQDGDNYILVYKDELSVVAAFEATKKTDDQGHKSIVVMIMMDPDIVEASHQVVAAEVGRVEFDCSTNMFQIVSEYEMDSNGDVIDEVTKDELQGWHQFHIRPPSIMSRVATIACGPGTST